MENMLYKALSTVALLEEPMFKNSTSKNDILTPWSVVEKHMTDIFGDIEDKVFTEDSRILELGAYNGYYAVYCAKKIHEKTGKPYEHILKENIFIATRKVFSEYYIQKILGKSLSCNVSTFNILEDDVNLLKGPLWGYGENELKFTAIVGNPPYQGGQTSDIRTSFPMYNLFTEKMIELKPRFLSLVIPAKWYMTGKGLDSFRDMMLKSDKISKLYDYEDACQLFPEINLKGGVCYFLRDNDYTGKCRYTAFSDNTHSHTKEIFLSDKKSDFFVRDHLAETVLSKINGFESFSSIVSSRKPFGLDSSFIGKSEYTDNDITLFRLKGTSYIEEKDVIKNKHWIDTYKIYMSKAAGSGRDKNVLTTPIFGDKNSCCTETYLMIGPFNSAEETNNCISFIKTKFFRYLVSIKKITHNTTKQVYDLVPLVNFTEDWSDEKLYKIFNLNQEEIAFIDKKINVMN